jgi:hypothetical protein
VGGAVLVGDDAAGILPDDPLGFELLVTGAMSCPAGIAGGLAHALSTENRTQVKQTVVVINSTVNTTVTNRSTPTVGIIRH